MALTVWETSQKRLHLLTWIGGCEVEVDLVVPTVADAGLFAFDVILTERLPGGGVRRLVTEVVNVRREEPVTAEG